MKNATIEDVKKAQETGKLEENVMYLAYNMLVHGKKVRFGLESFLRRETETPDAVIAETAQGELVNIDLRYIQPVPKGSAQQPKKPRRKPVKGTKPEQLIEMNESVKLKVGDKVLLKNGVRTVVLQDDGTYTPYQIAHQFRWNLPSGVSADAEYSAAYAQYNITHKIIPWQEQERYSSNIDPAHSLLKYVEPKSPEQEAFEKGYWVAHHAEPDSVCPPWAERVMVETLLADDNYYSYTKLGKDWAWNYHAPDDNIVAYRKAPHQ